MSVKRKSPLTTVFTIIILVALVGVLYYGLVLCTQAGPAAEEAAEKAGRRLTPDSISDISSIPYSLLSEPFKLAITQTEYENVMNKKAPDEETIALFEKLNAVQNEPKFLQGAATYYCGTTEYPIKGIIKIKGIQYEVTQAIAFAPNVKNFDPEIITWSVTVERITKVY